MDGVGRGALVMKQAPLVGTALYSVQIISLLCYQERLLGEKGESSLQPHFTGGHAGPERRNEVPFDSRLDLRLGHRPLHTAVPFSS